MLIPVGFLLDSKGQHKINNHNKCFDSKRRRGRLSPLSIYILLSHPHKKDHDEVDHTTVFLNTISTNRARGNNDVNIRV